MTAVWEQGEVEKQLLGLEGIRSSSFLANMILGVFMSGLCDYSCVSILMSCCLSVLMV